MSPDPCLISHFSHLSFDLSLADVRGVRLEQEAGRSALAPKGREGRGTQEDGQVTVTAKLCGL